MDALEDDATRPGITDEEICRKLNAPGMQMPVEPGDLVKVSCLNLPKDHTHKVPPPALRKDGKPDRRSARWKS